MSIPYPPRQTLETSKAHIFVHEQGTYRGFKTGFICFLVNFFSETHHTIYNVTKYPAKLTIGLHFAIEWARAKTSVVQYKDS